MVWVPEVRGPARRGCRDVRGGSRRVWSHSVRRWLVQMRCRECAAEVGVTARVCSRCGAPIVGQPPVVVADTVVADMAVVDMAVVDMAVAAISDAAGKAVPAGVAGRRCRSRMCRVRAIGSLRS